MQEVDEQDASIEIEVRHQALPHKAMACLVPYPGSSPNGSLEDKITYSG